MMLLAYACTLHIISIQCNSLLHQREHDDDSGIDNSNSNNDNDGNVEELHGQELDDGASNSSDFQVANDWIFYKSSK